MKNLNKIIGFMKESIDSIEVAKIYPEEWVVYGIFTLLFCLTGFILLQDKMPEEDLNQLMSQRTFELQQYNPK